MAMKRSQPDGPEEESEGQMKKYDQKMHRALTRVSKQGREAVVMLEESVAG